MKSVLRKIERNQPCPCGSGKKFKHCHGSPVSAQSGTSRDRVVKNPDGSIQLSVSIPHDELGPPFGYKELIFVPAFDERDMQPGEQQPSPAGSPGEYEVTFVFARPEISLTEIRQSDIDFVAGDSALIISSPEPRKKGDPSGVRMEFAYSAPDETQKRGTIMLRPNKHGRLSIAKMTLTANGYRQARREAYRALLPMLSKLSFDHDIPLEIKGTSTEEKATAGKNVEMRIPFNPSMLNQVGEGLHSQEILALQSFYREGMNSTSIGYSFLCFYRILEAIYEKRKKIVEEKNLRYKFNRENRIEERDLLGLPRHMENYKTFVGRKFRSIYDNELTTLRITIAHGLLGEKDPISNTPDDVDVRLRASFLIPIAKILARLEVQNELTRELIPIQDQRYRMGKELEEGE